MFTGLIEAVCLVNSVRRNADSLQIGIDLGEITRDAKTGESIAVNGVCLTISSVQQNTAYFNISGETVKKTNLEELSSSSFVNIERSLLPTDRLGGHFVQGHIDGTGKILEIQSRGQFADITFSTGPELLQMMVPKGSVAVDGISLTIAEINEKGFKTAIIPDTLDRTTLGRAKTGDNVNIETDIIAKLIKKQLDSVFGKSPRRERLTIEKLEKSGFL